MIERGPGWELRLGDWRDVLADVERVDAVICDPPYLRAESRSHHSGLGSSAPRQCQGIDTYSRRPVMEYEPATAETLGALASFACQIAQGWIVAFNDFDGVVALRGRMAAEKRNVPHEPLVWIRPSSWNLPVGNRDAPTKSCEFLAISRPKGSPRRGRALKPGHYDIEVGPSRAEQIVTGGKPLALMRAIVRDYSEPGDLICDPTAGGATTLLAAVIEGRRAIGAERDPVTFAKAVKRLRAGYTPTMFGDEAREWRT